jgi:hypothetical protein
VSREQTRPAGSACQVGCQPNLFKDAVLSGMFRRHVPLPSAMGRGGRIGTWEHASAGGEMSETANRRAALPARACVPEVSSYSVPGWRESAFVRSGAGKLVLVGGG